MCGWSTCLTGKAQDLVLLQKNKQTLKIKKVLDVCWKIAILRHIYSFCSIICLVLFLKIVSYIGDIRTFFSINIFIRMLIFS